MYSRRALVIIACLSLLTFGMVIATLGAVLPLLIVRFGIDRAAAGGLLFLNTLGIVVGSLVFGPIVDRYGYKEMFLVALALVAAGLEAIAVGSSMIALRLAVPLAGIGGGMINGAAGALVADVSVDDRTSALGRLTVFFGVGAVGMPFALSGLLGTLSYTTIIAGLGAVVLIPFAATVLVRFPPPKQAQGFPLAQARDLLRDPVLLTFGFALFLQNGIELTVGGWTTTYFVQDLQFTERAALVCVALYWCGEMLGRMALGPALRVTTPGRVLRSCLVVGFLAALVMVATRGQTIAASAVFLVGVGFSATFPVVLGVVADRYAALSGTAFSVVMVIALTGGTTLPFFTGVVAASRGLRVALLVVPIGLGLLAATLTMAQSLQRASRAAEAA